MSKFCGGCGTALASGVRFCESCGKPVVARTAGATPAPAPSAPSSTSVAPTVSKRPFLVVGLVLGGLLLIGVGISVVQSVLFSPKAVVNAYFDDLADGDADAARAKLGEDVRGEMLVDRVIGSDSYVAPADVKVSELADERDTGDSDDSGDTERADDDRRLKVTYELGGKRRTAHLTLSADEEKTLLVFRSWHIRDGLTKLSMPGGVPYQVNGVATKNTGTPPPEGDVEPRVEFEMFPGEYQIGLAENPLLSGKAKKAVLPLKGLSATEVSLSTTIKEDAKQEIDKQVKAYIDECAKETTLTPKSCPFGVYGSNPRNVKWTVVSYPTLTYRQTSGGSVYVETGQDAGGTATATYESKGYFSDDYESRTADSSITVGGPVVVKNGKIDWQSPKDVAEKNDGGD